MRSLFIVCLFYTIF